MKRSRNRWKESYKAFSRFLLYLLFFLVSPAILLIAVILLIHKYVFVKLSVKLRKPNLLQMLNEWDAFYACDRFWEISTASSGLVLILEGNINIDEFRKTFSQEVIEAKDVSSGEKLFPHLTQIPESFGGYYFWRKANYFLVHEHIRPIETPTDEFDLKKFAGTVLSLPFPNKRPLWEILVFTAYSKKVPKNDDSISEYNHSALVIRMHQSIGDPDLMLKMVALLCKGNNIDQDHERTGSLKLPPIELLDQKKPSSESSPSIQPNQPTNLEQWRNFSRVPAYFHRFLKSLMTSGTLTPLIISNCEIPAVPKVSWSAISSESYTKLVNDHNLEPSAVMASLLLGVLESPSSNVDPGMSTPEILKKTVQADDPESGNGSAEILVPIFCKMKEKGFLVLHNHLSEDQWCKEDNQFHSAFSFNRLQKLNAQLKTLMDVENHQKISKRFLTFLSLLPHPFLRFVTLNLLKGTNVILHRCETELETELMHLRNKSNVITNEPIFMGDYQLLDVIPLCGLHFRQCGIAINSLKFRNTERLSLTIHPELISTMISSTSTPDKQAVLDKIANRFQHETDKIVFEGLNDQGFRKRLLVLE